MVGEHFDSFPGSLHLPIFMKFGSRGEIADVIIYTTFLVSWFKG